MVVRFEAGERGELGGGAPSPLQVGGDQQVGPEPGEQSSRPLGLEDALVGELDVRRALEPRFEVPGGLAVPPEDDARPGPDPAQRSPPETALPAASVTAFSGRLRVASASSGIGSSGQSFHRRSSE